MAEYHTTAKLPINSASIVQNSQPTCSTPKNLKEVYDITKRRTKELRKEFYSTSQQSSSNKSVQDNENNTPPKYDDTEVSKPRSIQDQSTSDEKPTAVIQTHAQYKEQPDLRRLSADKVLVIRQAKLNMQCLDNSTVIEGCRLCLVNVPCGCQ
ncbi:hypothetical protein ACF0H5_002326 [Mactra antiquata]